MIIIKRNREKLVLPLLLLSLSSVCFNYYVFSLSLSFYIDKKSINKKENRVKIKGLFIIYFKILKNK